MQHGACAPDLNEETSDRVFAEFVLENHIPSATQIRKFIDKRLPNI